VLILILLNDDSDIVNELFKILINPSEQSLIVILLNLMSESSHGSSLFSKFISFPVVISILLNNKLIKFKDPPSTVIKILLSI
jgi:hypothetical protein